MGNTEHQLSVPKRKRHSRSSPHKWSSLCQREILTLAVERISLNLALQRASKQSRMDQTHKEGGNPKSANTTRAKSAGDEGEGRKRPCTPSPHPLQGHDSPAEPWMRAASTLFSLFCPIKLCSPGAADKYISTTLCAGTPLAALTNCWFFHSPFVSLIKAFHLLGQAVESLINYQNYS